MTHGRQPERRHWDWRLAHVRQLSAAQLAGHVAGPARAPHPYPIVHSIARDETPPSSVLTESDLFFNDANTHTNAHGDSLRAYSL